MARSYFQLSETSRAGGILYITKYGDASDVSSTVFSTRSLGAAFPRLTLELLEKRQPGDFFMQGSMSIVSDRFRSVAESSRVAAEFLSVHVVMPDNQGEAQRNPYWYMHMLEHLDCIDFQKSDVELFEKLAPDDEPNIRIVKRLVFREAVIGDMALWYPNRIHRFFVNEEFAKALRRGKLRVKLTKIEALKW